MVMSSEEKNIAVLIEDTDAFGRLNWRVFCRYCEIGEAGLLRRLGLSQMYFYEKYRISFPRRFASFEYLSQVLPTDSIDFETKVKRVGNTSLTLSHTFYKKSKKTQKPVLVAKAEVVIVAYDEKNQKKTPLPKELVDKIRELLPEAFDT
jgi:acyl-CoA thioesterase FadM